MPFPPDYYQTQFFLETSADLVTLTNMINSGDVALITGYATTGEVWTDTENTTADQALHAELNALISSSTPTRITGGHPETAHCEPGWAVAIPLDTAIELAEKYRQDAIYYIKADTLWIHGSTAGESRSPAEVGSFLERVTVS